MELSINDLGIICEAVFEARTKAYDIGLILKVPVGTLDSIESRYDDVSDKFRETLKAWLRSATKPVWQSVVGALRSQMVGQPKLASDIEAKYCNVAGPGEAGGPQPMLEPQQPTTTDTKLQTLQEELLRIKDQQLQELTRQMEEKQRTIDNKETQLCELNRQLETIKQDLLQCEQMNQQLQVANDQLRQKLQQNKQAGQSWQLQAIKQVGAQTITYPLFAAQPQDTITQPRQELQQAQQTEEKLFQRHENEGQERQPQKPSPQLQSMKLAKELPSIAVMQQKTIQDVKWKKESKAPEKMYRGSTATDSNMAYFGGYGSTKVYSYNSDTQKWHQLPNTPHIRFTLVMIAQILTMVGGYLSGEVTNSLLSLMGEGRGRKWLPHFPAMPTSRYSTAAICSGHSLIVTGGYDGDNYLATVEVLDIDTQQWSTACSLPHPFYRATISLCGQWLYMMGGEDETGLATHTVITCSVHELLQSCQTEPLAGKLQTAPAKQATTWQRVADAPYYSSSCTTLCGQLVAVGGRKAYTDTTTIFSYDETTDSWTAMGDMPTARSYALVAVLNGKIMVVGGRVGVYWSETDVVEIMLL